MALQSRKAERDALSKVVSEPSEDKDQVLKDGVIAVLERFLGDREFYVVGMEIGPGQTGLYGPYLSRSEAERALKGLSSPFPGTPAKAGIWRLYDVPVVS
jgi:hypothetical protein